MKRKKTLRILAKLLISGVILGGGIGLYMLFMPQRDIQKLPADYNIMATDLVAEFLDDISNANNKYLAADGESKILEVTGRVARVSENFNGETVVLLKGDNDKAGVSCTFMHETNERVIGIETGDIVSIKGVIRSGAYYDKDLDMYVNATVEKCDMVD